MLSFTFMILSLCILLNIRDTVKATDISVDEGYPIFLNGDCNTDTLSRSGDIIWNKAEEQDKRVLLHKSFISRSTGSPVGKEWIGDVLLSTTCTLVIKRANRTRDTGRFVCLVKDAFETKTIADYSVTVRTPSTRCVATTATVQEKSYASTPTTSYAPTFPTTVKPTSHPPATDPSTPRTPTTDPPPPHTPTLDRRDNTGWVVAVIACSLLICACGGVSAVLVFKYRKSKRASMPVSVTKSRPQRDGSHVTQDAHRTRSDGSEILKTNKTAILIDDVIVSDDMYDDIDVDMYEPPTVTYVNCLPNTCTAKSQGPEENMRSNEKSQQTSQSATAPTHHSYIEVIDDVGYQQLVRKDKSGHGSGGSGGRGSGESGGEINSAYENI